MRMRDYRMLEADMIEMADEVVGLIEDRGCRKLVFCLGPGDVVCLYSVFLAKLVMIRRHVLEKGGFSGLPRLHGKHYECLSCLRSRQTAQLCARLSTRPLRI